MHTIKVLAIGFAVLGLCVLAGRTAGGRQGMAVALLVFLPMWFAGAGINMYMGVKRAGYSVAEEAPVFLFVFLVPSAVALLFWWKMH
jgi:hypothetical protein